MATDNTDRAREVARLRHAAIRRIMHHELRDKGIRWCGDNSCMFGKPDGQGTNGGCRCFGSGRDDALSTEARQHIQRMARVIRSMASLADPALIEHFAKEIAGGR